MVDAVGPVFTGGFEAVAAGEGGSKTSILFLPDKHNDELQRVGKAPVYYWMPDYVRLARKGGTDDYKFRLLHFVGVRTEDGNVGVEGQEEVAGGVLSLTTTMSHPADVLEQAQTMLLDRFRGKDLKYWGWRTSVAPMFRPMPIRSSHTTLTNLSPNADGSLPAGGDGPAGPADRIARRGTELPQPSGRILRGQSLRNRSNIDPWLWHLQGQGPGSINPNGENAFSGLIGTLPAAILWEGFRGAYSPVAVTQALKLAVWTQALRLKMTGEWNRVFTHFSAHVSGRAWWFTADIKAEFNKLVASGTIKVELEIDGTRPGADEMEREARKRIDTLYGIFMQHAAKAIFEPAPEVPPAEARRPGGLYGLGVAMKLRRDSTHVNMTVDETVNKKYLQDHVISSSLEGFYDEIKADPEAEKKYFQTIYLDDWDRKVSRIVKPVVNWPDPTQKWIGEPVNFLSCSVGYPNTDGDIMWSGRVFQSTDTSEQTTWEPQFAMKDSGDVASPPEGWSPDVTYVKRKVHFNEPPGESDSPFMRVFVEKNEVDLDPPEGTPINETAIEVRADSVGKLEVGPIALDVELEGSKQVVEVEFKADGQTAEGHERSATRFKWKVEDQEEPRYWEIFTGQPDFVPSYQYRVRVIVKGSLFSAGMEWTGDWNQVAGNGPVMVDVPTQDEAVSRRNLRYREIATDEVEAARGDGPPPLAVPGSGAPSTETRPQTTAPSADSGPGAPARGGPGAPRRSERDTALEASSSEGEDRSEREYAGFDIPVRRHSEASAASSSGSRSSRSSESQNGGQSGIWLTDEEVELGDSRRRSTTRR